jgi:hypothetical protein
MQTLKNRLHAGQFTPQSVATVVEDNESLIKEYLEWKESYAAELRKPTRFG